MKLFKHECGLYAAHAPQWSINQYRQDSLEKGDMIYITMRKIIDDNDRSEWAYNALEICGELLYDKKRWPDSLNSFLDATTWIECKRSECDYKLGISHTKLYRPQTEMTRDPYTLFYAACVALDRMQFVEVVSLPIHLWRPVFGAWKYYLLTGRGKRLYEWLELIQMKSHKKEYTRQLVHYRAHAARSLIVLAELGPISEQYLYTN